MNKRIRELAEQAEWRFADQATGNFSEYDNRLEKFAALIVQECALTLESITVLVSETYEDFDNGYNKALLEGSTVIKQRFGVE